MLTVTYLYRDQCWPTKCHFVHKSISFALVEFLFSYGLNDCCCHLGSTLLHHKHLPSGVHIEYTSLITCLCICSIQSTGAKAAEPATKLHPLLEIMAKDQALVHTQHKAMEDNLIPNIATSPCDEDFAWSALM